MISAVLDTNVLISGLGWGGVPGEVVDAGLDGRYVLVTSPPLLEELGRVLARPRLAPLFPRRRSLVGLIARIAVVVDPTHTLAIVEEDPADNRLLEAAEAAGADFIVTGDHHLLEVGSFAKTELVPPKRFLEILTAPLST